MLLTLLIDPPQDGLTNMAVDEALLAMAAAGELGPVLRFYQWSPATLSLGYFQRYAERAAHPASAACDVVRRASGGGAILHDRELTYSLVLPAGHPLAARAEPLYRAVHQSLVDVLAELGLGARFWDDVQTDESRGDFFSCNDTAKPQAGTESILESGLEIPPLRVGANPSLESHLQSSDQSSPIPNPESRIPREAFLCFERRSPGDLVLRASGETLTDPAAWHKILGSAQRRRQGAVLQHGSLVWGRSNFAPELPGVSELAGTEFAASIFSELIRSWSEKLAKVLDFELSTDHSSSQLAFHPWLALAREKFHEPAWLHNR